MDRRIGAHESSPVRRSGVLPEFADGLRLNCARLRKLMMVVSDNTAPIWCSTILTTDAVNARMNAPGF